MRTALFAGLTACALMAGLVTPAFAADETASLKLKTPATAAQFIHDGSVWHCKEDTCTTTKTRALPAGRACRKLAGQLGELTAFTYRGAALDEAAVTDCNTAAKR
ncbi:hypothetical protein [Caulobacter sp. RHG1]|uniref:CC_3452 family protein n=1 Tax=Caulobacter sp. (strain RHG1) TaxID=2545762 RepID=UPI00155537FB|nr:hypothetical protein [Caulobacter sp. RHG1]NQE61617.1 hypothetical protein [Caulobacter sp. RHG1]